MARIRTIKPEFPHSESMGRVSRDARLLFIELWTICDDYGRCRAVSRMLASLLFPYDDDAPALIDGWLAELQREGCVWFYEVGGSRYLQVCNWSSHQKVDRTSGAKCPEPDESSRGLDASSRALASPREPSMNTREGSSQDLDRDRDRDHVPGPGPGPGGEREGSASADEPPKPAKRKCKLPDDWEPNAQHYTLAVEQGVDPNAELAKFRDHAIATGRLMLDWDACFRTWLRNARGYAPRGVAPPPRSTRSERILSAAAAAVELLNAADQEAERERQG